MTTSERDLLRGCKRVVVKIGSQLVAEGADKLMSAISDDVATLQNKGIEVIIVSSGAIALGREKLSFPERPKELPQLQATASVGQNILVQQWETAFSKHGMVIGQFLLTHDDLSSRKRFISARRALRALLSFDAVPIVNENDSVGVEEITFGDNDLLAALLCNVVSADALLILTDVDGLHDAPPEQGGKRIPKVVDFETEALPFAGHTKAEGVGTGGMLSKVQAARIATKAGVPTVVFSGRENSPIQKALSGNDIGTVFLPREGPLSSKKHWLAYGTKPLGYLSIDDGALRAVRSKGSSLLPAGIKKVKGSFGLGDIVGLRDSNDTEIARGLAGYSSADIEKIAGHQTSEIESILGYKYLDAVIHRDDLALI